MITTSLRVPSSIERIMIDLILDSILCLGDDALRIQITDSKFTGQVDPDFDAVQLLTLMGSAYDIERLVEFVENELICHVYVCKEEMRQMKDKTHAIFQVMRCKPRNQQHVSDERENTIEEWRNYNRMRRYRCYQKIQKEVELRATDYRVRKVWDRKLISDVVYYDYQSFPENAKLYLHKFVQNSDESFINQLMHVLGILKKEQQDSNQNDSDQSGDENYDEDENLA
jgi:hypothetical protein